MRAADGEQARRDRLQEPVADEVAAGVVDGLEAVEVEVEQGGAALGAAGLATDILERALEAGPVGQSRQGVVAGQEGDAGLRRPARGHVGADAAIAEEGALPVEGGFPVERPPARPLRRAKADREVAERQPGLDRRNDRLDVPAGRPLGRELAQDRQDVEVLDLQVLAVPAEQAGKAAAGMVQAPGPVRLPEPVARALLEILQQQADGLALLLHHRPVPQALARQPAHAARAEEHERRVDREQDRDVLAHRRLAAEQADEQAGDHRRGEQERDAEDRADDVGVRHEPGADRHQDDPVGVVHARQQHRRQAGPGQAEREGEQLRDGEAPPHRVLARPGSEGAAVAPGRRHREGAQEGHRPGQAQQIGVGGDVPEHVGERHRHRGLRHGGVVRELQRLAEHRHAGLVAQPVIARAGGVVDPAVRAGAGGRGGRHGGAHGVASVRCDGPAPSRRGRSGRSPGMSAGTGPPRRQASHAWELDGPITHRIRHLPPDEIDRLTVRQDGLVGLTRVQTET